MGLFFTILIVAAFLGLAVRYAPRIVPEAERPETRRRVLMWALKGVGLPVLVWTLLNAGAPLGIPPLMPEVARALTAGGNWWPPALRVVRNGILIIGSLWIGVTLVWMLGSIGSQVQAGQRAEFLLELFFASLVLAPLAGVVLFLGGWMAAGIAAVIWFLPLVHYQAAVRSPKPPLPLYSRALARMKMGKNTEAEWAIIQELEKCENDFEGWMMLAELYACHFHDLPTAEQTVLDLCLQSDLHPALIGVALNRLADWHLQLGNDPVAARRTLEVLCQQFPGTHLSRMAQQRLEQLPATREELLEQRQGRRIRLPALRSNPDAAADPPIPSREDATIRANRYVEKLRLNPNDVPAREELARIFAEDLAQPDLAIEQIELLLGLPEQPDSRRAAWLSLIAGWRLRFRRDEVAGRQVLEQLIRDYPDSPQAFAAQRRLFAMEMERKFREARGVRQ